MDFLKLFSSFDKPSRGTLLTIWLAGSSVLMTRAAYPGALESVGVAQFVILAVAAIAPLVLLAFFAAAIGEQIKELLIDGHEDWAAEEVVLSTLLFSALIPMLLVGWFTVVQHQPSLRDFYALTFLPALAIASYDALRESVRTRRHRRVIAPAPSPKPKRIARKRVA